MDRKMFDTPVLPRLETILAEVKSGDLVVPEFQRPFVWDDDRRINLLDSIWKGMPIGSLLVWRTTRRDLKTYRAVGGVPLSPRGSEEKVSYLIDGHQRISTLFGALFPGEREAPDDDEVRWPLYYELGAGERPAFHLPPRKHAAPDHWLPLNILLDGDRLFDFTQRLRQAGKRDLAKEAERLANVFRDYILPIVPLVTEELDVVTDAFVRINSQGKSMSEAHMLRALTHLGDIDTEKHFAKVREKLEPRGFGALDDQVLVNVLKAQLDMDVYASGVRELHDLLRKDAEPLRRLPDVLEETMDFLAGIGVMGPGALPYSYQLVTLAAVAAALPGQLSTAPTAEMLRAWFWTTTYTERYTGSTGNQIRDGIREMIATIRAGSRPDTSNMSVRPLTELRMSAVRSRAFLLFLAQLPEDPAARARRQEALGTGTMAVVPPLSSKAQGSLPGNRVIAEPGDLRRLRDAIKSGQISPEMADEFCIPAEAVSALPDQEAFIAARSRSLLEREKAFIEQLGLRVSSDVGP